MSPSQLMRIPLTVADEGDDILVVLWVLLKVIRRIDFGSEYSRQHVLRMKSLAR